jgi:hypothetical protein
MCEFPKCAGVLTVKNGASEVANELLEQVGLLTGDLVVAITLPAGIGIGGGETRAKLGVEVCKAGQRGCSQEGA